MAKKWFQWVTILSIGLVFMWQWDRMVRWTGSVVALPMASYLWVVQTYVLPVRRWYQKRLSYSTLIEQLEIQELRCQALQQELIRSLALERHEYETRELREFAERYRTEHAVLAHISLVSEGPYGNICWLDVGSRHGVAVDMTVVAYNFVVGRIMEVTPYNSCVMLVTDRRSKVPVAGQLSGAKGICEGAGGGVLCQLSYVSHLENLCDGELLLSSGECAVYPRGFAVGTVANAARDRAALQYRAYVKPLLEARRLTFCYVLQKGAAYLAPDPILSEPEREPNTA